MIAKRKEKRVKKKIVVSFGYNRDPILNHLGISLDISKNGMCIVSNEKLSIDKNIFVLIATENNVISLKGELKWNKTYSAYKTGIGVFLASPPLEYTQFVNKFIRV